MITGYLRMLEHREISPVLYEFVVVKYSKLEKAQASEENQEKISLNQFVGKTIQLTFSGEIRCINCGAITKKSFGGGACYKCFITKAEFDLCILKPENCHFHLGTCREPEWGQKHCFKKHVVYLANTSGLKVGITKENPFTKRWVDQGAVAALPILEVNSRLEAGLVEVKFAKYISDKTSWQKIISSTPVEIDLIEKSQELFSYINLDKLKINYQKINDKKIYNIQYPILEYPTKKISLKPDPQKPIEGKLLGIRGQYLLFPQGALNVRTYEGYKVSFQVKD